MKVRRMPYRKQFTGSPWQQGGPPFGMNQMGGGMGGSGFDGFGGGGPMGMGGMDSQFAMGMMGGGFGRNQGYGGYGGMGPMGMSMGYGMGGMSRMKDRRGSQQNFRNQRKRPMQSRSPVGNQRKRSNYDVPVNQRNRVRRRSRNNKIGGRNNYGRQRNSSTGPRRRRPEGRGKDDADKDSESADGELYNPAEPTDDFSEYEYEDGDDMDEEQEDDKEKGTKDAEDSSEKPAAEVKTDKADGDAEVKTEGEVKADEKNGETDKEKSKNGIQVTIQQGEKGRSVSQDKDKKPGSKKNMVCHVCKIVCSSQEKFRNHMNGRGHKEKMETLLVLQREKAQALEARMKASHHMRTDSSKSSSGKGKKNQNWCTVCECAFVGNFLSHRRTKEHRRKRDKKYPKCRPCRMGFSNPDEYKEHCTSEEHKKKASMFHSSFRSQDSDDDYVIVDATGIFEDEDRKKHQDEKAAIAISDQLKDLMQVEKDEEILPEKKPEKTDQPENAEETKTEEKKIDEKKTDEKKTDEKKTDEKKTDEKKTDEKKTEEKTEEKPVATTAVLLVNGYYCKLCYKFFGGGPSAKIEHCKSRKHIDNYKRSLPRPKKESTEKDKNKGADKNKDAEKKKEGEKSMEVDNVKEGDKKKEESVESKDIPAEKSEKAQETKSEDVIDLTETVEEKETNEKAETMDVDQPESADKAETKEEDEEKSQEKEAVQVTTEKPDADVSMDTDDKDASFVSAKDHDEETETAEKDDDTEKSSPGVRRGRSARGRGRKRT